MNQSVRRKTDKLSSERGSILAISAISMLAILLATGLAVDIGHFYLVAAELQNAADAAALSGASALNSGASGIHKAVDRAVIEMNKYEFNKTSVTIGRENVLFAKNLADFDGGGGLSEADAANNPATVRFVQVTIPPKAVKVYFSVMALGDTANLSKKAVAGQSVGLNYFENVVPLSVVQDDATQNPQKLGGKDKDGNDCGDPYRFTPGCTYTVRLPSGKGVTAGNYQILDLTGGGGGGNEVAQALARGADNGFSLSTLVDTKTGVNAGDVAPGINTRFDLYKGHGLNPAQHPPDANVMGRDPSQAITYSQYVSDNDAYSQSPPNNPTYGVGDRRVVLIPILNLSQFSNGKTKDIQINTFGAFFIQSAVDDKNGDIRFEYIGERTVFGSGGYEPGKPTPSQSLTVAVLYR